MHTATGDLTDFSLRRSARRRQRCLGADVQCVQKYNAQAAATAATRDANLRVAVTL